jgi:large repetitive protein
MFRIAAHVRLRGLGLALATILAAGLLAPVSANPQSSEELRPNAERGLIRSSGVSEISRIGAKPIARGAQSATFQVNYDAGFNANPSAKAAFQRAVDIWSTQITSSVPITVDASFAALDPGVLGSAGASYVSRNFSGAPRSNTWYPAPLAAKLRGSNSNPGTAMITAQFSSTANWYYGTDGNTPGGQSDFVSVVLHEIGHGLGFSGSGELNSLIGSIGYGNTTVSPDVFDVSVVDGTGLSVLSLTSPSATLGALFVSGNLYWNGTNGVAGNGGTRPKLYAPTTWQGGSSYSHLDESTYAAGNANSLMTPAISGGESIHDPGPITRGMFQDMGWTIDTGSATATPTATPTRTPSPTPTALSLPIPTLSAGTQRSYLPTSLRNMP